MCNECDTKFDGWMHDGDIPRCPVCYPSTGTSMFEIDVGEYVKSLLPNDNATDIPESVSVPRPNILATLPAAVLFSSLYCPKLLDETS